MQGKTVVITGATGGIGKVTAQALSHMGAKVVVLARDAARGKDAIKSLSKDCELYIGDLASQDDLRRICSEIKSKHEKIDVLVNNAGAIFSERLESPDGIEMTIALNHLSYFILSTLLLDPLMKAEQGRIVNVSSAAHQMGYVDFTDFQYQERRYNAVRAYNDTKLMNVLFTYELARRLKGTSVTCNCLHPGAVKTGFGKDAGGLLGKLFKIFRPIMVTPEQGARTSIYLASSPEVADISGKYFVNAAPAKSSVRSYDEGLAARLWYTSKELTGLD
ncbi:SDR family oxidoreductase [Deinococcus cellulosilyticus]|uniref:Short-chain dehydrogenase n=1 Tax=Deinococcus cellulosilyticus (strain DSM 18568 / NBRC 106333 / KACC 11606 / 5516J-15) TaxID=1223518 RepID=A0A511MYQ6_DEIC1|nr:SDR family oxidoreductase [Deinococcus cellulosilyticus]GEM45730.1 short-chain dehydrogenase [Deinococcus cellulosilyticus NBRC 106333 = KACC 11606]